MQAYSDILKLLLDKGQERSDRTGVGTRSVFGHQIRFDLAEGFPLLTLKKTHFPSIVEELLWFIRGESNVRSLQEKGVRIWNEWADEAGELGPVYGVQWRAWPGPDGPIDQLAQLLEQIQTNPDSRRLILSAWNVAELPKMALAPCHCFCQFYVQGKKLSAHLYQRSADAFLGLPFNIASYSLLLHLVAQACDLEAHEFVHSFGDLHLYNNHLEQAKLVLEREPYPLPRIELNPAIKSLFDFCAEDIKLLDYQSHPFVKADVAI